jgi:hypothetical protein
MRTPDSPRISSYREFWPFYLREHAGARTRAIHIAGTGAGLALVAGVILGASPYFLLAGLVLGYGPAWLAHFLVEKNRPASFRYPLWSLVSDLRMAAAWLSGNLEHELEKAGIARSGRSRKLTPR